MSNLNNHLPSNPSLVSEEERHYQNVSFHQGAQDPRMGSHRGPRPVIPHTSPHQAEQRPASAFLHRGGEEFAPHQNSEMLQRPASQKDIREAKFSEMSEEVSRRGAASSTGMYNHNRPQHLRTQPSQFNHGYPGQYHTTNVPAGSPAGHNNSFQQQFPHSPGSNMPAGYPGKQPPPTAPKPNNKPGLSEAPEKPLRHFGYHPESNVPIEGPPRPPLPEDGFRESPPPPPPPT